jgi:hypothetical protein
MNHSKPGFLMRSAGVLIGVGLLMLSGSAMATDQSQKRQEGRDVKQDAKQDARAGKVDCKAADQKSNSECRQDKRDTKQDGREDKRDTKH